MTTEQIIEEREDSVKMKMRFKRFLSGFMAVATLASTIIQPVTVSASELEPQTEQCRKLLQTVNLILTEKQSILLLFM